MAVVVTARPPVEAPPTLSLARGESSGLRWLALAVVAWYGVSLVAESATRFAVPGGLTEGAARAFSLGAFAAAVGLAALVWLTRRDDAALLLAATLAAVFAAGRGVSNGVLLRLDQPTLADVVDVGLGLLVLGSLVWSATASMIGFGAVRQLLKSAEAELLRSVVDVTAVVVFAVGVTGAIVRAVGASWACRGTFPDCNGLGILPFGRDPLADIQLYHRLLSYVALALVAWVTVEAFRSQRGLARAALLLLGTTLAQAAIGVTSISSANPTLTQALHTAGAAITFSAAVMLAVLSRRHPALVVDAAAYGFAPQRVKGVPLAPRADNSVAAPVTPMATPNAPTHQRANARTISAYVQLTKPRVMSLLLATTATAMVIAARGLPDLGILAATLIGGALMSGGAGAINHYVDRDIDPLMGRTAWRPIPSGVISPRNALVFGILLAALASAVFIVFVNPLACLLAILGLLGYVFIYTLWLKRSTPSNIVIGGAAGAIPPLVGWAAVTNEIGSLTAWYLFAIIFFWTPPHFWALSLLIRQHYERAGVPMLPVVRGEDETRRQIVLYSILLVVLTLVLSPFGMMGVIYFAAAVVLGALFIRDAVRLWRRGTREAARRLYLYSMLYLFALFAAMAVDRVVTA
jgi:protoheme IX farnesyltransferase